MKMYLVVKDVEDKSKVDQAFVCVKVMSDWKRYEPEYFWWCLRYLKISCNVNLKKLGLQKELKKELEQLDKDLAYQVKILASKNRCNLSRHFLDNEVVKITNKIEWYEKALNYITTEVEILSFLPVKSTLGFRV